MVHKQTADLVIQITSTTSFIIYPQAEKPYRKNDKLRGIAKPPNPKTIKKSEIVDAPISIIPNNRIFFYSFLDASKNQSILYNIREV